MGLKSVAEQLVARQAYAGLLWSKQFYHYVVQEWLHGDKGQPPPPTERLYGRNTSWIHLFNRDVISVPDKWEYPWVGEHSYHDLYFLLLCAVFLPTLQVLITLSNYIHMLETSFRVCELQMVR